MKPYLILVYLFVALPDVAIAQSRLAFDTAFTTLTPMDQIRVFTRSETVTGRFGGLAEGAVAITTREGNHLRFRSTEIDSIARRSSNASSAALKGASFGALALAAIGAIVDMSVSDRGGIPIAGISVGALSGGAIGGLIGLVIGQSSPAWVVIYAGNS